MHARRRLALAAVALSLVTGATACSDDGATSDPTQNESVAPGTGEEGAPGQPLNEGESPEVDVPIPSEGADTE